MQDTTSSSPDPTSGILRLMAQGWWAFVIAGLVAVVAGVIMIAYPDESLRLIAVVFGIYLLIWAAAQFAAVFMKQEDAADRFYFVSVGIAGLIAGLLLIADPEITRLLLSLALGIFLILIGTIEFFNSFDHTHHRALYVIRSLVSLAVGILVLANSDPTIDFLITILGIYLIVRGLLDIIAGIGLKKYGREG